MNKHSKHGVALSVTLLVAAALTGCSGGPSKGDLKDGLATFYNDKPQEACWNVQNSANVSWPIRIPLEGMSKDQVAILNGLKASGIADISEAPNVTVFGTMGTVLTISLTDKGRSEKAWDPQKGFCVGKRQVQEVTEFTEPGKDGNTTDVKFTWQYQDLPSWADRDKFKLVGMAAPVADETVMEKTNNGWRTE